MLQPNLLAEPPRSFPGQIHRGFILLHTLVLLLIGSALVAVVLGLALGRSRDSSAEVTARRLELAAESGVHSVLFQLLGNEGALIGDLTMQKRRKIDGIDVALATQFSDGLVGLRSAEKRYIQEVLVAALGSRASAASSSLSSAASLSSYADLASLEGVGADGLACLLPYVTLYSERLTPVSTHAPPRLKSLLALRDETTRGVIQEEAVSLAGSIIRIQARASSGQFQSRHLLVEAMITGRTDQPVWILEWFWTRANLTILSELNPC